MTRPIWLLLLLLAIGLWSWLARGPSIRNITGTSEEPAAVDPGYVSVNAELIETGDDGQPLYRLRAQRVEQQRPDANVLLAVPRLNYQPDADSAWSLTAAEGELATGQRHLNLRGDVQAQGGRTTDTPLLIRTEHLAVDMQQQRVDTRDPVAIDWGRLRVTARGLRINLKDGSLRLESQGHGELAH